MILLYPLDLLRVFSTDSRKLVWLFCCPGCVIIAMDAGKGQGGIQMLLTAEQEAQQIVASARNSKILASSQGPYHLCSISILCIITLGNEHGV